MRTGAMPGGSIVGRTISSPAVAENALALPFNIVSRRW